MMCLRCTLRLSDLSDDSLIPSAGSGEELKRAGLADVLSMEHNDRPDPGQIHNRLGRGSRSLLDAEVEQG